MKELTLSEKDRCLIRTSGRMQPARSFEDMRVWVKVGEKLKLNGVPPEINACSDATKTYKFEDAEYDVLKKVFKASVESPPQGSGWTFDVSQYIVFAFERIEAAKDVKGKDDKK